MSRKRLLLWAVVLAGLSLTAAEAVSESEPNTEPLKLDSPVFGHVLGQQYLYFRYQPKSLDPIWVYVYPCTGNPDLYVSEGNTLPTMHSYSFFSINGRSTDFVEIPSGVGRILIGVYGMSEADFMIVVTNAPRKNIQVVNPQVKVTSISGDRVSLMWLPVNGQHLREIEPYSSESSASAVTSNKKKEAVLQYNVFSLATPPQAAGAADRLSILKLRQSPLDSPCGMRRFGKDHGYAVIQQEGESQFFHAEIRNLEPQRDYAFNIIVKSDDPTYSEAAYSTVHVRTEKFTEIKLHQTVRSSVEKGKYRNFRLTHVRSEQSLEERDNFYRESELVMRFTLLSGAGGDADLYVSLNAGPATFMVCDYSMEALMHDQIDIPITETYTSYYVGVYGKEATDFTLTARLVNLTALRVEEAQEWHRSTQAPLSETTDTVLNVISLLIEILAAILDNM